MTNFGDQRIAPRHLLASIPAEKFSQAEFNRNPVGTGPFKFVEWVSGSHITLQANADYFIPRGANDFRHTPYVDRFILKNIMDENARMAQLRTGELHAFSQTMSATEWAMVKSIPTIDAKQMDGFVISYFGFNLTNPLFKDARVRQAIAYAIDRDTILDKVLLNMGSRAEPPTYLRFHGHQPQRKELHL